MAEGTTLVVGLDVHKDTLAVALADGGGGEVRGYGVIANTPTTVARLLKKLGPAARLRVCYEAGPCGYVLDRQMTQVGIAGTVVAPALIPANPGDKIKTDRKDGAKLARWHRAGELTAVAAPTPEQEAGRDLTRARQAAQQDLHRLRQRLRTFLLRQGVTEPAKTKRWSAAWRVWRAGLSRAQPAQQTVLDDLRQAIGDTEARVGRLTAAVEAQATSGPFAELIRALTSLRGIGVVTAVTVVAELGDPGRFDNPRQLMAFAGLVPSEHSSGGREQRGRITKTGNAHVRYAVVAAAWPCRRNPHLSQDLRRRQRGQSEAVTTISWPAQERLHQRYVRLVTRGKPQPKAAVAIARELVGFVWAIARQVATTPAATPAEAIAAERNRRGGGARALWTGGVGAAEECGRDAGAPSVRPWRRHPATSLGRRCPIGERGRSATDHRQAVGGARHAL
jgi:transposase